MKIYVLNDTSEKVHSGSDAVMRCIYKNIKCQEIIKIHRVGETSIDMDALSACDGVLVNGEGTLHHRATHGIFLMECIKKAQKLNKKTYLINCMFQEKAPFYNDVLKKLTYFSVRDPESKRIAQKCGADPEVFLDLCADPDFQIGGKSSLEVDIAAGAGHWQPLLYGLTYPFRISTQKYIKNLPYPKVFLNIPFEDVIETLKHVNVYITGQHHAFYAGGLAGTSMVLFPSNSHKIEAMVKWSKLPIKICYKRWEFNRTLKWAQKNSELFKEYQSFLLEQKYMSLSDFDRMWSL